MKQGSLGFLGGIGVLLAIGAAFGQSGDFTCSGKVLNAKGTPIPMATITYTSVAMDLSWDFSKADGTFGTGTSTSNPIRSSEATISFPSEGPVSIDVFEMGGKLVGTFSENLDKGTYSIQPLASKLSQSMYMLRIKAGNAVTYQKLLNTGFRKSQSIASSGASSTGSVILAKKLASLDTVRVGKTGYKPVLIAVTSYTQALGNVTLDTNNIDSIVTSYMGKMSQAQIVGQMCMPVSSPGSPVATGDATGNSIGAIFGGGGALSGSSASASASSITTLQNAMMGSGAKIPLLAAYDFVHGASAVPGATMFPHNLALGAIQDTLLVQKAWRVAALEIRGAGCNWGFGPCIAVIRDDRWGRSYEGFCETPGRTALMARHAVLGCQTTDLSNPMAYAACVKHFAGDGNTTNGVNQGTTVGPDATARAINLPGYVAAVAVGAASAMPSFTTWCDGTAMSFNTTLLTTWLKNGSGSPATTPFQGFLVSDWEAGGPSASQWQSSINAGMDMPMAPGEGFGIISDINGIYGSRVQDACKRILRIKAEMNLFSPSQYLTNSGLTSQVGSAAHRAVARACVRASQVLLKNNNSVLPIPKNANVAVWGQGGNDIGIQCGGWTVSWQGDTGSVSGGTSIYQGVQAACTGTKTYSRNASASGGASYIIAVLSENPYAEVSFSDISLTNDITYTPNGAGPNNTQMATSTNSAVMSAIATAHAAGTKVIVVLIAGRPLDISTVLPNCDAFVWACLPGTEGNGITDVLFGDYNFTGKLPVTWPKASGQLQTDQDTVRTNGLYAFGYGLTY